MWLESSEEHLPKSIAGVLRLRSTSHRLRDTSARRFAQDDGFVGGGDSFMESGCWTEGEGPAVLFRANKEPDG